mmetsp:Transcript_11927/g.25817  ORF Transcript_11927/g.25817 Transcript_11927/m.25817 type:complete len:207 (+) Transcript_11927:455-1075(+)
MHVLMGGAFVFGNFLEVSIKHVFIVIVGIVLLSTSTSSSMLLILLLTENTPPGSVTRLSHVVTSLKRAPPEILLPLCAQGEAFRCGHDTGIETRVDNVVYDIVGLNVFPIFRHLTQLTSQFTTTSIVVTSRVNAEQRAAVVDRIFDRSRPTITPTMGSDVMAEFPHGMVTMDVIILLVIHVTEVVASVIALLIFFAAVVAHGVSIQ